MLEIQKYLQTHKIEELKNEFDIRYKIYDDRIIFKYGIKSPKYHPIVKECRGLILSLPDYKILSRPFDRFYNLNEGNDHETFNWSDCTVFNKLDGSLIQIYNDTNKWCIGTSGTAFAEGTSPLGKSYHDLFLESIGIDLQEMCKEWDRRSTFLFELTSPENRIVTPYSETKCTLLAIRNKFTNRYYTNINKFVDFNKKYFTFVDSYDFKNPDDIVKFVESRDKFDEGCVCFDNITQKRIKIKNSSYVSLHHLRGNEVTKKSIVTLLLKNEMDEFLTYFSDYYKIIDPYRVKFDMLKRDTQKTYSKYKDIKNQKEFAMKVKNFKYSGFLFSMRKGFTLEDIFDISNLNQIMNLIGD